MRPRAFRTHSATTLAALGAAVALGLTMSPPALASPLGHASISVTPSPLHQGDPATLVATISSCFSPGVTEGEVQEYELTRPPRLHPAADIVSPAGDDSLNHASGTVPPPVEVITGTATWHQQDDMTWVLSTSLATNLTPGTWGADLTLSAWDCGPNPQIPETTFEILAAATTTTTAIAPVIDLTKATAAPSTTLVPSPPPATAAPTTAAVQATSVVPATTAPAVVPTTLAKALMLDADTKSQGDAVEVTGSGYKAGSSVDLDLHSDPIRLASVTADASGTFRITLPLPAGALGAHQIWGVGIDPNGTPLTQVTNLTITAEADALPLAFTGNNTLPLVVIGVGLLVLGLLLRKQSAGR